MNKPPKPHRSELRVRISDDVLKAVKLAVIRHGKKMPAMVEWVLATHPLIKNELPEAK